MLSAITGILGSIFGWLSGLFPDSPFSSAFTVLSSMNQGIGWLNWFVPINAMADLLLTWILAAVAVTAVKVAAKTGGSLAGKAIDGAGGLVGIVGGE